jgi:hypothetical protein
MANASDKEGGFPMNQVQMLAERAIGPGHLQILQEHGLTVVPKVMIDQLKQLQGQDILFIEGRPLLVRPVSPGEELALLPAMKEEWLDKLEGIIHLAGRDIRQSDLDEIVLLATELKASIVALRGG